MRGSVDSSLRKPPKGASADSSVFASDGGVVEARVATTERAPAGARLAARRAATAVKEPLVPGRTKTSLTSLQGLKDKLGSKKPDAVGKQVAPPLVKKTTPVSTPRANLEPAPVVGVSTE